MLGKLGKHEEALNCFENVCREHPRHTDSLFHKGIELAELGRHENALKIFDKLLSKHKDNPNVLYAKARSLAELDQVGQSMEYLKNAVRKDPKTIRKWAKAEKAFERFEDDERFRRIVK